MAQYKKIDVKKDRREESGFTLIELSIVLVIIGLIVGGVLVGQDLIRAAEVRAQISQIEKYNTAVNTFRGKYNAIPGDMNATTAAQFGFAYSGCAGTTGLRDGNGLLDGSATPATLNQGGYETGLFWADLSNTGMTQYVDGTFNFNGTTTSSTAPCTLTPSSTTTINLYFPVAKIGHGNYVYVYESSSTNYYGLSAVSAIASGATTATPVLTVLQAYNIDKKMDDGMPATGGVQANYVTASAVIASTTTTTANGTTSSCYDTATSTYSLQQNGGAGANCALSFAFQ